MKLIKKIYYQSCSLLPMQLLNGIQPATTLLPYHHTVSSEFLPHIKHLYNYKNEKQFIRDLDFLLAHYHPVSLNDIIISLQNKNTLPKKSFLLSFDDGFKEVHDIVAPILEKKGVPAIFFINPAFIDNKELFYRCKVSLLIEEIEKNKKHKNYLQPFSEVLHTDLSDTNKIISALKNINQFEVHHLDKIAEMIGFSFDSFLQNQQPFLSSQQLQSLHNRGFAIGAHSINHPYYPLLSLNDQQNQTIDSCNFVNKKLGTEECSFSFPYSDTKITQEFFETINQSSISLFFGIQNQKIEIWNKVLHRFNAERPGIEMDIQIKGLIFMMWLRKICGKVNVKRN